MSHCMYYKSRCNKYIRIHILKQQTKISSGPILFLYLEESPVALNLKSKQLRFYGAHPNVDTFQSCWNRWEFWVILSNMGDICKIFEKHGWPSQLILSLIQKMHAFFLWINKANLAASTYNYYHQSAKYDEAWQSKVKLSKEFLRRRPVNRATSFEVTLA